MNISKEAKKELDSFLTNSLKELTNGVKAVKGQMPKIAEEIITYEGYIANALYSIHSLVWVTASTSALFWAIKTMPSSDQEYGISDAMVVHSIVIIASAIVLGVAFCILVCCITQIIKAKFAPKLFILSYLTDLLSKK